MRPSSLKVSPPVGPVAIAEPAIATTTDLADVGDLWRILSCRRNWVLGVMVASTLAALVYVSVAPSQYTATAQILIDPRGRQIVTKDVNPDSLPADGGIAQVESQSKVIESDAVLLRAITNEKLDTDPDYGGPSTSFAGKLVEEFIALFADRSGANSNAARNKALRLLRSHLAIKRADKVFVVDVTVTAATAAKAARISDAIAEAYIADQVESRGASTRRASEGLANRLDELRDGVRDAENQVERYKREHDLVGTERTLVTDQQLEDSGAKLANARSKTAELRARVDQIEALRRSGADIGAIPEALQSTVITQLRSAAQELLRREADLRTRVGDRYPDMIAAVEQVKDVKRQINAELARLARSARSDLDRAAAVEKSLVATLDRSKLKTLASDQSAVQLHELNRELEARRSLYQAFLSRSVETKAQTDIDTSNARILSRAIPPDQASWPPRVFVLLGAIAGGLGLGIGVALVIEYMAPTILSFTQLQRLVGAPVVGILPPRIRPPSRWSAWFHRETQNDLPLDNAIALALSRLCGPLGQLVGVPEPYSLLLTSTRADDSARVEAIDRAVRGAARRGINTLLVEADFGSARSLDKGFLDVLRGDCSLSTVTRTYGTAGVKRVGLGEAKDVGAMDALRAGGIDRFLDEAAQYFDLIVFDGGAFEENSQIAPVAGVVDDVVLIAVRGSTLQRDAVTITDAVAASSGQPISAAILFQA